MEKLKQSAARNRVVGAGGANSWELDMRSGLPVAVNAGRNIARHARENRILPACQMQVWANMHTVVQQCKESSPGHE